MAEYLWSGMLSLAGSLFAIWALLFCLVAIVTGDPARAFRVMGRVGRGVAGGAILAVFTLLDALITVGLSAHQAGTGRVGEIGDSWMGFFHRLNDRLFHFVLPWARP